MYKSRIIILVSASLLIRPTIKYIYTKKKTSYIVYCITFFSDANQQMASNFNNFFFFSTIPLSNSFIFYYYFPSYCTHLAAQLHFVGL